MIYVHWHIIQSQKQTQEKDMWNPKAKFAKPKKDHKIYSTKDLKERCSQTGDRGRKVVLLVRPFEKFVHPAVSVGGDKVVAGEALLRKTQTDRKVVTCWS